MTHEPEDDGTMLAAFRNFDRAVSDLGRALLATPPGRGLVALTGRLARLLAR